MDSLLLVFVLLVWLLGLIFALVALAKAGDLRRDVQRLERRLRELERERLPVAGAVPAPRAPPLPPPQPAFLQPPAVEPSRAPVAPQAPPSIPTAPPARRVDWERRVGVEGAAVIGGLLLALAGVLLYRHAIEQGWITPVRRVIAGLASGGAGMVAGELLRRRGFTSTPQALEGAGAVALFAAIWAADVLYGLIGLPLSWFGMGLVTLACGGLAHRSRSQLMACLGLAGGFATPLLLHGGFAEPLVLFGYAFLLDAGLLLLARRHAWPVLTALGLAGTLLLEVLWLVRGLGPGDRLLALSVLTGFTLLFAAALTRREGRLPALLLGVRATAIVTAFLFAFALSADEVVGTRLHALTLFVAAPALLGQWFARREGPGMLGPATGVGAAALVLIWSMAHREELASGWEVTANAAFLGLLFQGFLEWQDRGRASEGSLAAAWSLLGVAVILGGIAEVGSPWPYLAALVPPAAMLLRQGLRGGREPIVVGAVAAAAVGVAVVAVRHGVPGNEAAPPVVSWIALLLLPALAALLGASRCAVGSGARRVAGMAVAAGAVAGMAGIALCTEVVLEAGLVHFALAVGVALALSGALLAQRPAAYPWLALACFGATALASRPGWGELFAPAAPGRAVWTTAVRDSWPLAWLASLAAAALVTVWPFAFERGARAEAALPADPRPHAARATRPSRWVWAAAAAVPLLWWTILDEVHLPGERLVVPEWLRSVALLALTAAAGLLLRGAWLAPEERRPSREPARTRWFGLAVFALAATLLFARSAADVARDWTGDSGSGMLFGLPAAAACAIAAWRRTDAPVLAWLGTAAGFGGLARLLAQDLDHGWRLAGWHAGSEMFVAHACVASSCFLAASQLARHGPARVRREGGSLLRAARRGVPAGLSLAGHGVVFAWLNLLVRDFWAPAVGVRGAVTRQVRLALIEEPAWALATSGVWIAYALLLLVLGIRRRSVTLRWTSLLTLLAALCKVVLYDLGELEGLYRVGSLSALGLSLLAVPLAYQRFVFGRDEEALDGTRATARGAARSGG